MLIADLVYLLFWQPFHKTKALLLKAFLNVRIDNKISTNVHITIIGSKVDI